jgi:hypothetical protein
MSRINLNPREPDVWVTVGWDPPLQSYFIQVFREPKHPYKNDEEILWRGFGGSEAILKVGVLQKLAAPYVADFPDAVVKQLILDKAQDRA